MNTSSFVGQDSAVGIATRCRLDGRGGSNPGGGETSRTIQTGTEAHPASCTMGSGSFPGAERPKGAAEHRLPSSAGLGMGRSYTSASPLCLQMHDMGWPLLYLFPLPRNESRFPGCRACSLLRNIPTQYWHTQIATDKRNICVELNFQNHALFWLITVMQYKWHCISQGLQ
jgi:hypothetical protein